MVERMPENAAANDVSAPIPVDRYRAFIFPNRVRELRLRAGHSKLAALAAGLADIPYIRLSKIERGEVVARAWELRRIAAVLGIAAEELLIDVDTPEFDIASWARAFVDEAVTDDQPQRFAIMVAAAVRARRAADRALTIAVIERDYGIPPVILSRFENAQKPVERWNPAALASLFVFLGVSDLDGLRAHIEESHRAGKLAPHLNAIASAEDRLARTRERVTALMAELRAAPESAARVKLARVHLASPAVPQATAPRTVAVFGAPLADGRIAAHPTGETIEVPGSAGPRAFAVKVFRQSLGMGLPGQATVIVDPDRYPAPGGIVAVREDEAFRLLAVTIDRDGILRGHSVQPEYQVEIDTIDPSMIATAVAAMFI